MLRAVAFLAILATAPSLRAASISDTEVLAIVQKHCVMCHAAKPTHENVQEAPKNVTLETVSEIKRHAAAVYSKTVQTNAMPLGNQTGMTADERSVLGQWLKGLP
ncbi:MAG TPA: hypothetical protein VIV34_11675 [Pseudolabrys sp.]